MFLAMYLLVGSIYLRKKNYPLALDKAIKSKLLAVEAGDITAEREATSVLYDIYKATGNKALALDNFERFIVLKDSILKEENQRAINNKEVQYEYEKKSGCRQCKTRRRKKS